MTPLVGRQLHLLLLIGLSLLLTLGNGPSELLAQCNSESIGGIVYRDYNSDGRYDSVEEPGVPRVRVTASVGDSVVASGETDASGAYRLAVPAGTTALIEFSNIPDYLKSGYYGSDSRTTVQRRSSPDCEVHLGLQDPGEYCPPSAQVACTRFVAGGQFVGPFVDTPAVVGVSEDGGSNGTRLEDYQSPTYQVFASSKDVGATFGLAYRSESDTVYAGSFVRRHAGLGPTRNPTTIYAIDRQLGTSRPWLTLDPQRVDPHTGHTDGSPLWPRDFGAYAAVFKEGLGDLELSHDGKFLYAVDLGKRQLVEIELAADGTPGTRLTYDLLALVADAVLTAQCTGPTGRFASDDVRPFGLGFHNGELYLGVVCSAQSTVDAQTALPIQGASQPNSQVSRPGDRSKLHAYVYAWNRTVARRVIDFPLNYRRGCSTAWRANCQQGGTANWFPWVDRYPFHDVNGNSSHSWAVYAQPVISDIEFDKSGMILALGDRFSFQTGPVTKTPPYQQNDGGRGGEGDLEQAFSSGDILRACQVAPGEYVAEYQISGDTRCQTTGLSRGGNSGDPIDEYYYEDDFHVNGPSHDDIALGSLLQLPGRPEVMATTYDPVRAIPSAINDNGINWYERDLGIWTKSYLLIEGTTNNNSPEFRKTAGLGDLEGLCDPAPLQIGNRVWYDQDRDGVQDSNEEGIGGVLVSLYDTVTDALLETVVTAPDGTYYFGGSATQATPPTFNLSPRSQYEIRINLTDPNLTGLTPTGSNQGVDSRDSDGQVLGSVLVIPVSTAGPGVNDHTYDFGFATVPDAPSFTEPAPNPTPSLPPSAPLLPEDEYQQLLLKMDSSGDLLENTVLKVLQGAAKTKMCKRRTAALSAEVSELYSRDIWFAVWAELPSLNTPEALCGGIQVEARVERIRAAVRRIEAIGKFGSTNRKCANMKSKKRNMQRVKRAVKVVGAQIDSFAQLVSSQCAQSQRLVR